MFFSVQLSTDLEKVSQEGAKKLRSPLKTSDSPNTLRRSPRIAAKVNGASLELAHKTIDIEALEKTKIKLFSASEPDFPKGEQISSKNPSTYDNVDLDDAFFEDIEDFDVHESLPE